MIDQAELKAAIDRVEGLIRRDGIDAWAFLAPLLAAARAYASPECQKMVEAAKDVRDGKLTLRGGWEALEAFGRALGAKDGEG